jgi:8-oxo-dGTP diphosphatase
MNQGKETPETDRFRPYSAVYLILKKGNKVLLLRRANTGYMDGKYSLPAGHIDAEEYATQAIIREAKEEVGISLTSEDITFAHVMHRASKIEEDRTYIDFYFTASHWEGEIQNCEPDKCDDIQWFETSQLPKDIVPDVEQAIESSEKGIFYTEFGWD